MRALAVLATLLAASGAGTTSAAADSETVVHDRFSDTFTRTDTSMCAFPIEITASANIDDALFFRDGSLTRVLETVNHVEITFAAPGSELTARGTGGIDIRFNADGTFSASTFGIDLELIIPGYGPVFLDAGHAVYLFDPHPHVLFESGPSAYDVDAFCAAMS